MMRLRTLLAALVVALAAPALAGTAAKPAPERPSDVWNELRGELFDTRPIADGAGMMSIDAPYRAHDAALVPVEIEIDPGAGRKVARLTLIVDENPAPVAAQFEFGPETRGPLALATRLRVNAYSNVRAIAELDDGTLHQTARFVKASGGCSAPAGKDAEAALANLGKMKLRQYSVPGDAAADGELQLMIRHPNNSGFQLDQVTQLYVPAWYVHEIEVSDGDDLVFRMSGGISLSEDPTIRFNHTPRGDRLRVLARDTDGGEFVRDFPASGGS